MGDDVKPRRKGIHIGLIPDGNRRYAKKRGKPPWQGHWDGAKKIEDFLDWCLEYPEIKRISIFALSTENLERSRREVSELWDVYKAQFKSMLTNPKIKDNGIQVRILGNDGVWKAGVRDVARELVDSTKSYSKHILNILLAYGSKFEINRAVMKLAGRPVRAVDRFLMVREPLDLVIRTGGQRRLSNFMLYQAAYAELWFSDALWPEFSEAEFSKVMNWYHRQQKNLGH